MKKIKPTWEREGVQLYLSDCLDILPSLQAGSVDAVVTDPPYGVDKADWDNSVPHHLITEFLRIATGTVIWFGSASNLVDDARCFPVPPERTMIWAPRFILSKVARDGFAYRFHPLWFWRVRKQKSEPWDVFSDNCEGHHWWNHSCTKPLKLMVRLSNAATAKGGVILDPFLGSGTTGVACVQTGRSFIGIEIDPKYFDIAVKRIEQEMDRPSLFKPPTPKVKLDLFRKDGRRERLRPDA